MTRDVAGPRSWATSRAMPPSWWSARTRATPGSCSREPSMASGPRSIRSGAYFNYFVHQFTGEGVSFSVADSAGTKWRSLSGPGTPGFHRVAWDLQREPHERIERPEWSDQPEFAPPGKYTVTLTYGEQKPIKQTLDLRHAPGA